MQRGIVFIVLGIVAALAFCQPVFAEGAAGPAVAVQPATVVQPAALQVDEAKVKLIAVATEAVKAAGFTIQDVNIVYDDNGKLWSERIGYVELNQNANRGILVRGFMKNYKIIYFDYKEPVKDVWVFIDKDSAEVLEVFQEK